MFMEKKFTLTKETCVINERTLYRIRAEKDFGNVKKGDLGGFVEKEVNLSHRGNAWIYNDACVFGDAKVFDDAYIYDNAYIYGNAYIYDNAHVYGNTYVHDNTCIHGDAHIYDDAHIYGNADIYDNARVYDTACVYGNARVYVNANIFGTARVHEEAHIRGDANIFGNANVHGNAHICGEARVCEQAEIQFSRLETDLREDLKASLRCQCNLMPEDEKVIAYKLVRKNLCSLYDKNFIYRVGETAVCKNPKEDNSSCSPGLHFSNLTYWDNKCRECLNDLVYLKAEIDLQDIITVQEGKIRCRKARILSKIEIE